MKSYMMIMRQLRPVRYLHLLMCILYCFLTSLMNYVEGTYEFSYILEDKFNCIVKMIRFAILFQFSFVACCFFQLPFRLAICCIEKCKKYSISHFVSHLMFSCSNLFSFIQKRLAKEARAQEIQAKNAALGKKVKEPAAPKTFKGRGEASFYRVTCKV